MQIIDTASQIETLQLSQRKVSQKLSASVEIILLLLKVRFKLTEEEYEAFRMNLSPYVADDDCEQGWEDVTNAAMTNLLKTCLAKGGKAPAGNMQ
jgi:Bardet-Biedl syndrome 9 protein